MIGAFLLSLLVSRWLFGVLRGLITRYMAHATRPRPFSACLMGYSMYPIDESPVFACEHEPYRARGSSSPQRYVLSFPPISLTPGERADLTAVPQVHFRPSRLFVSDDTAPDFRVESLRVGPMEFFAVGSLPARIFSDEVGTMELDLQALQPGEGVSLTILCEPRPEGVVLWGRSLTRKLRTLSPRSLYQRYQGWRQRRRDSTMFLAYEEEADADEDDDEEVPGYPEEDEDDDDEQA